MDKKIKLDTVESAIKSIKKGEIIIVVDDHDRENEGDFVALSIVSSLIFLSIKFYFF